MATLSEFNKGVKIALLISTAAFFVWASYWLVVCVRFTLQMITESSFFIEQTGVSWWTVLFFATENVPSLGIFFRWIVALMALYSAAIIVMKKEDKLSIIKRKVSAALFLEGANYLTLIPVLISGVTFAFVGEKLWYYGQTPPLVVVLINGITSIAILLVIPPVLFKLRSKIVNNSPLEGILKWVSIAAVSYLFIIFWFVYSISFVASFVPWTVRAQPGIEILLNPLDLFSFAVTVFGFLAIALYALKVFLPAIKERGAPNLRQIGIITTGVGVYFALMLAIYLAVGYHAHPTVWMEIIMPVHNPDWWCLSFIVIGPYLIALSRKSSKS
jgi:hypothetical protein